jgi:uncharacterized protein
VNARYYLDTSALVKLYHQEAGTEQVEALFTQSENSLIISELAGVELYSTVARKVRAGEINEEAGEEVLKSFDDDCERRFIVTPLSAAVTEKAKGLLQTYGKIKALRALDALHLAACVALQAGSPLIFVCSDSRLSEIAALEGLEVFNPELHTEVRSK